MKMNDYFKEQIGSEDGLVYGRIHIDYGYQYKVMTEAGEVTAQVSGKYRNVSQDKPVIGDWVGLSLYNEAKEGLIQRVLLRKTEFVRKVAGNTSEKQVQGANFDRVFIVMALNNDFNLRKLERFILAAWDTGAIPTVILTKKDLCPDSEAKFSQAKDVAIGVEVHLVSALTGDGMEALKDYMNPGDTIALFGASGVGKSTLINTLAGEEVMKVNRVRKGDDRGTHTTTHRELVLLQNDLMMMDTPGMRELGIWDDGDGIDRTFSDIAKYAAQCRFNDCSHTLEPGCAIREAIDQGSLEEDRYQSYLKLQKEARFIEMKNDQRLRLEEQKKWKKISKASRKMYRNR